MTAIRNFLSRFSVRALVITSIAALSLILFAGISIWWNAQEGKLTDQQAAERWGGKGYAQVSCFLAKSVTVDDFTIGSFENQLEKALTDAGVMLEDTDDTTGVATSKRLYIDAYSAQGTVTVVSDNATLSADAIGIGGDYFYFHPLQLVDGRYFSENELMKDFVILDEDAAWQLFGSNDIAGMGVTIGGVPHTIAGVVKRDDSKMAQNAGLTKTLIYVSEETLSAYGNSSGICCYEVVAPEPVRSFVKTTVQEKFGFSETEMEVVENTGRYSALGAGKVLLAFGTRSMQNASMQYPFFENIARGYEDIRALVLVFQTLFLLIPGVILLVFLINKWKHRTIHMKDVIQLIDDKRQEKLRLAYERAKNSAEQDDVLSDTDNWKDLPDN